jgi:hypothetical protein
MNQNWFRIGICILDHMQFAFLVNTALPLPIYLKSLGYCDTFLGLLWPCNFEKCKRGHVSLNTAAAMRGEGNACTVQDNFLQDTSTDK